MLAAIDRIPPPLRGALATLVMVAGTRYGIEVAESTALAIVTVAIWVALGVWDVAQERRKREGAE